eukprot:Seg1232.14 transcript_id=Seg1232.14/GoldUCD/mRNA.D3Y31 product=Furin protein_id=Seg1232.14/GoldUCD/D3Y31
MNDIGGCLKHSSIITYADDTVLFTSSKCVHDIERGLNEDINSVHRWLNENELILNLKKGKTEAMLFGTGMRLSLLNGKQLEIHVDGKLINSTTSYKYLGVHLDPTLTLATHFDKICKKAGSRVNMMRKIRNSLTSDAAEALYRTMVLPIFTYCGTLSVGLPDSRMKKIESIEKRGKNIIASTLGKNMEIRIPSVSSLIKRRACSINDKFGVTMNIRKAWSKGYTGKNVTICINDPTGVYYRHDDFIKRFNLAASYNFDKNISDPSPPSDAGSTTVDAHGSEMTGLAASEANNGKCGVGIAYDAYISGLNTLARKGRSKSKIKAASLVYANEINDIYSCSWGPIIEMEATVGYMKAEVKAAVKRGSQTGRSGKGSIYVFANGNGGQLNGSCSYDEYMSSIYTLAISVVTGENKMSRQNVQCTGVSAVTYARDGAVGIANPHNLMPTCGNNNVCIKTSSSSSAAAAVASGILALVLQANPNLGWRDVQHLIARSSSSAFPSVVWKTNKAGIRVSDGFGFGLLDADALTENAKNWTNVGPQLACTVDYKVNEKIHGVSTTIKTLDLTTWPANCGGDAQRINFLEHVLLVVSFNFTVRKLVEIEIEAPTGTKSLVLRGGRIFDTMYTEVKNLSLLSLHHWGENPKGIWSMRLRSTNPSSANSGNLWQWGFHFYGTKDDPLASNTIKPSQIQANVTNTTTKPTSSPRSTATQPVSSWQFSFTDLQPAMFA